MATSASSSSYQMWITFNSEKQKLRIPVLPETITITAGSNNDTIDLAEFGEITIKQARPAYEYSFESFFPAAYFPGCSVSASNLKDPLTLIGKLLKWMTKEKPVHLILTDLDVSVYCTIEDLKYWEDGGDVGTIHYSITLKEYQEVTVRKVKVKSGVAKVSKKKSRVSNKSNSTTYTTKKGDTLFKLAKKFYGDGSKYTKIYNANKKKVANRPKKTLTKGIVLKIPKVSS